MTEETNSPKEVITTFEQWWALHGKGMARVQVLTMWHLEKVAHCAWNTGRAKLAEQANLTGYSK